MGVELREVETEEKVEEWAEEGGEGGMEGGGGGSSILRTRACAPAGEPASAAGERRRAFFALSACIGSPPCSCGGVAGGRASVAAGGSGDGARDGTSGACTKQTWWYTSSERVPASDGASGTDGRIGDAGVGGGSVASVGADGFAPGRPGRRPGAAAVAATNRSLRHPLRLSLL